MSHRVLTETGAMIAALILAIALLGLAVLLEPIQEVPIHEQRDGLVKRRSMRRIMASRTKAATVRA